MMHHNHISSKRDELTDFRVKSGYGPLLTLLGNPFGRGAFERVPRLMRADCKQRKGVSQQCQKWAISTFRADFGSLSTLIRTLSIIVAKKHR